MTDTSPRTVIQLRPKRPPLRVIDCQSQSEGHTMTALQASVQRLYPGMDIGKMMEVQARERLTHQAKEAWRNWCEATDAVLAIKGVAGDPVEHMVQYINEAKGERQ